MKALKLIADFSIFKYIFMTSEVAWNVDRVSSQVDFVVLYFNKHTTKAKRVFEADSYLALLSQSSGEILL